MSENRVDCVCPVRYTLEHARHVLDVKIFDMLGAPERMAVFRQLKAGGRLILFRDYENRRDPRAVCIARSSYEPLGYLAPEEAAAAAPLLEEKKYLYAIISQIAETPPGFSARVYVPEQVIPESLSRVVFQLEERSGRCFPRYETCTLSVKEKKFVFEETTRGKTLFRFELFYTPQEWRVVQRVLEITNFLSWEKSYDELDEDYDRWSVAVKYNRDKEFRSTGARIRPEEMKVFTAYIDSCLYIRNKKGRGTFVTFGEN